MKTRLLKELHLLLLPGTIMAVSAALVLLREFSAAESAFGRFSSFIFGFAMVGLILSIVLTAALPFGSEFQQRTLIVLLSQPLPRICTWREKLLAVTAYILPVCLVLCSVIAATGIFKDPNTPPLSLLMLSVAVVVCSAGFWTMTARSTIGGAAFTLMGIALIFAGTWYVVDKVSAKAQFTAAVSTVGVIYSLTCLWLGWRRFARMEARDVLSGEDIALPQRFPGATFVANLLRARAQQPLGNMIRKELRLQKPLVFLLAIFVGCWVLTYLVLMFDPTRKGFCEVAFNLLTAFYVPLVLLLAGCVSAGEEASIGTHVWHLTLPPPARRQWFLKLITGLAAGGVLGVCLPYILALMVSHKVGVGLAELGWGGGALFLFPGFVLVLAFWAGTLTGSTVRAALVTVALCVFIGIAFTLSESITQISARLFAPVVLHALSFFREPPMRITSHWNEMALVAFSSIALFALWQSSRWFRRPPQGRIIMKAIPIVALAFLADSLTRTIQLAAQNSFVTLRHELSGVLPNVEPPRSGQRNITLEELDPGKSLRPVIRNWLSGAVITIQHMASPRNTYAVVIVFDQDDPFKSAVTLHFSKETPP